jgi:hypothetical protein
MAAIVLEIQFKILFVVLVSPADDSAPAEMSESGPPPADHLERPLEAISYVRRSVNLSDYVNSTGDKTIFSMLCELRLSRL